MKSAIKYKIERDTKLGRYLIADEFLEGGSLIFTDVPFAIGPKPDSPPTCLGCHGFWNKKYYCSRCGWPCCSKKCEDSIQHKEYECEIFTRAKVQFQKVIKTTAPCLQYECITPLRMLLSKEKNPDRWEKEVKMMEDHEGERRQRSTWDVDHVNITEYLRGPCDLRDRFPEELIQKVCGILEVNSVEIPSYSGPNIRGIYPTLAIMSHNCIPNVVHTILSGGENGVPENFVQVWAAHNIGKGEKLELSYTHVLYSTVQRRHHLKLSKFFDCDCKRCADPTESNTNLSALNCNHCENGSILPKNPLSNETEWNCTNCKFSTTGDLVSKVVHTIQKEIDRSEESIFGSDEVDRREDELRWFESILHPKHALSIGIKYGLCQAYGQVYGYKYDDLSNDNLNHKINLCKEVLHVLDVVSPGQTRMRGIILYELHSGLTALHDRELKSGKISKEIYQSRELKALEFLKEAGLILSREDEKSLKGSLGRSAMELYKKLKDSFE